jgi:general secretion pathway protein G
MSIRSRIVINVLVLMVVVAIGLAIVICIREDSKIPQVLAQTKWRIQTFMIALEAYKQEWSTYPDSLDPLITRIERKENFLSEGDVLDPWGNSFIYVYPGKHWKSKYDLYSCGPNGNDDCGKGDDIPSWEICPDIRLDWVKKWKDSRKK